MSKVLSREEVAKIRADILESESCDASEMDLFNIIEDLVTTVEALQGDK